MKMSEFKALPDEEQLRRLNEHLLKLRDSPGRLENNFKTSEFDFSYSTLKKSEKELGITVDGKLRVAYKTNEGPPLYESTIVNAKQDDVKDNKTVEQKQDIVNDLQMQLTREEMLFVKDLFKNNKLIINAKQNLFVPIFVGEKKTTGISVYVKLWERWGEFKKKYPMYSGTDLMAMALEEFMEKYV